MTGCFTAGAFYMIIATLKGKNSTLSYEGLQERIISVNARRKCDIVRFQPVELFKERYEGCGIRRRGQNH